ncbi:carboxylate-amine ligase [Methylorubrum aminovorans]|uniref:Putative glutamate--cysteine ligase 2 n=1 Tax=Methylorubrum aminovorans TaxID=269069 RepID=A0ABQ4UB65_9HYPH|nr:carboxylate-amine ligase [Methylorubrum aminovorans]GJE64494.1 Putative glutamate--cysteine ligase 2 [Methylorubrum aminovorans]GMA76060.1 putative glutamate--cysteine ligase 2 [Methylorubrum aminovorans]
MTHEYRFGIEEELFLASSRTRAAPRESVSDFHRAARSRLEGVEREMLESQTEICSKPSASFDETHEALAKLRTGLCAIGREHGLKIFAAGTHPTAIWTDQRETAKVRYRKMIETLQMVGRRSIVSGLHVHVEVPEPSERIALINRLMPFLPVLLALSTSSPFYERHRTGLAGYRLRAYAELPRTGLPELFDGAGDFERYVRVMTRAGAIEDATYLWWHIRPSIRYPTLELRVADSCTRLKDTLAVAALYRCLVRLCVRRPDLNAGPTGASRGFVMENLWRAQRDGVHAALIDEAAEEAVPVRHLVARLVDLVAEDAAALGCAAQVAHALTIAECGSSADGQIRAYEASLAAGGSERKALSCVIDWLARETANCDA